MKLKDLIKEDVSLIKVFDKLKEVKKAVDELDNKLQYNISLGKNDERLRKLEEIIKQLRAM